VLVSGRTGIRQHSAHAPITVDDVNPQAWPVVATGHVKACPRPFWCQRLDPGPHAWTVVVGGGTDPPGEAKPAPEGLDETEPSPEGSGETAPVPLGSSDTGLVPEGSGEAETVPSGSVETEIRP